MNNTKCGSCGLVNRPADDNCKRCGQQINRNWRPEDLSAAPSAKAKGFSILPFVMIAVVAGGGYAFWQYGTKNTPTPAAEVVTVPAANTAAGNAAGGDKPILETAIAPANGQQSGGGIGAKFQNSKAITDANSHADKLNKMMAEQPQNTPK